MRALAGSLRCPQLASAEIQGPERWADVAKARPRGPPTPCRAASLPFLRQASGWIASCNFARAPLALPGLGFLAIASAPSKALLPAPGGKREKQVFGATPAAPSTASPGPSLAPAGPSPSSEPAVSRPPYSPLFRTKKAPGNPGLAGVQVISCFLMGSNSD